MKFRLVVVWRGFDKTVINITSFVYRMFYVWTLCSKCVHTARATEVTWWTSQKIIFVRKTSRVRVWLVRDIVVELRLNRKNTWKNYKNCMNILIWFEVFARRGAGINIDRVFSVHSRDIMMNDLEIARWIGNRLNRDQQKGFDESESLTRLIDNRYCKQRYDGYNRSHIRMCILWIREQTVRSEKTVRLLNIIWCY